MLARLVVWYHTATHGHTKGKGDIMIAATALGARATRATSNAPAFTS